MRPSRPLTMLLAAMVLVGGSGEGALATSVAPAATVAPVGDQAGPTPSDAFQPIDCPVQVAIPEGAQPASCGLVGVPQRHADPGAGQEVAVAVARVPAADGADDAPPVVVLAGGSDGSALDMAPRLDAWRAAFPGRDLVLLDHRGGRYSTPFLRCGDDDPTRIAEALGQVTGTAALDAHVAAWTACATRLRDEGFDPAAFDAAEAAADVADVVAALGYADGFDLVTRWAKTDNPAS